MLPLALGDEGLEVGHHRKDVGEELPFTRDQGRLARVVMHPNHLLPRRMMGFFAYPPSCRAPHERGYAES